MNQPRNTRETDMTIKHIAIRTPVFSNIGRRKYNVIEEHNRVVNEQGFCFLAKFGQNPDKRKIESIIRQIGKGIETKVILFSAVNGEIKAHAALIDAVAHDFDPSDEQEHYPPYYDLMELDYGLWMRIRAPFEAFELDRVRLVSNGKLLRDVAQSCRTPLMIVSGDTPKTSSDSL